MASPTVLLQPPDHSRGLAHQIPFLPLELVRRWQPLQERLLMRDSSLPGAGTLTTSAGSHTERVTKVAAALEPG